MQKEESEEVEAEDELSPKKAKKEEGQKGKQY